MRTLSGALSAALGAAVQRPALLVEAQFSTTQRWSSMGTVTWSSQTWTGRDLRVEGLQVAALQVSGTLVLGNADDVAGTLALGQGVADKVIRIWGYDAATVSGGTLASGDAVWLCDAVGSSASIGTTAVRIALRHRAEYVTVPRTLVLPANGFNRLLPRGTVLRINGIDYKLDR